MADPSALPTIRTARLTLRPFTRDDASRVQELAGTPEVALTTLNVPHPYGDGMAEAWIASHEAGWREQEFLTLAITCEPDGLVGAVSLTLAARHRRGEIGYWVGVPFWNRGYATEAARALLELGFEELELNRIQSHFMTRNPSSGRVMEKLGMKPEGVHRQLVVAHGRPEDVATFAILRSELPARRE